MYVMQAVYVRKRKKERERRTKKQDRKKRKPGWFQTLTFYKENIWNKKMLKINYKIATIKKERQTYLMGYK